MVKEEGEDISFEFLLAHDCYFFTDGFDSKWNQHSHALLNIQMQTQHQMQTQQST